MNAIWVDLETTGLNPNTESVLEIGLIATTLCPEFEVLAEKNWVCPYLFDKSIYVDPFVREMHTKNGLWHECNVMFMQDVTLQEIEQDILGWIDTWDGDDSPIHGSTPSFDRAFLFRHFPYVEKRFHYRSYDVSTLIAHARSEVPEYLNIDRETHRAIPDLEDSIANAIHFRNVFRPTGGSK